MKKNLAAVLKILFPLHEAKNLRNLFISAVNVVETPCARSDSNSEAGLNTSSFYQPTKCWIMQNFMRLYFQS